MSESVMDELADWIKTANPGVIEIPDDLDIIETRTITSLQFVEFLLYIEKMRGEPIPTEIMDINSFRTLRTIVDHYFSQPVAAGD